MKRVMAIANQKGGVGKTTTAVNLAASLAATKRRTLLIDLDPQGNATMGCGIDKNAVEATVCDVLLDDLPIREAMASPSEGNFSVVPSNQELTVAEVELLQKPEREYRLRRALEAVADDYDYLLIDCPPAINMLTVNALAAFTEMIPLLADREASVIISNNAVVLKTERGTMAIRASSPIALLLRPQPINIEGGKMLHIAEINGKDKLAYTIYFTP
jgi:cellulose biosynthesis protein BcsQ